MVICLERGADCLHMVQLMPLHPKPLSTLALLKSRLVLPFWHRLTQVVLEKRLLNGCNSSTRYISELHFSQINKAASYALHRCGLLLHVLHVVWSVCLLGMLVSCGQKLLNRS